MRGMNRESQGRWSTMWLWTMVCDKMAGGGRWEMRE